MKKLEGKVAIITGASQGIGFGCAMRFAKEGATVAMCGRNPETLEKAAKEVAAVGGKVIHKTCDVTSGEQIDALIEHVLEEAGTIDILVNNAAYMPGRQIMLEDADDDEYHKSMDGGINSVYYFMKRLLPVMKKNGGGKIVNFTSMGGIRGVQGTGGYAAGKTAIIGLSRVAANEWGKYGINVNMVAPMAMSTGWEAVMETLPEGTDPWSIMNLRGNALGYVGDPEEDIAPAVVFLASDDARHITGHVLPLDGGQMEVESPREPN